MGSYDPPSISMSPTLTGRRESKDPKLVGLLSMCYLNLLKSDYMHVNQLSPWPKFLALTNLWTVLVWVDEQAI